MPKSIEKKTTEIGGAIEKVEESILPIPLKSCSSLHSLTQSEAAEFFGVNQPRISNLMCGKIEKFTIDILINMLVKIGMKASVAIEKTAT